MTKVAIHQPNFLPWLGYFYKIHLCDVFIILDDVQFVKRSYINRTNLTRPDNQQHLLSIPIKKHSQNIKINEVLISNGLETQNIFETFTRFYKKKKESKIIEEINNVIRDIRMYEKLIDFNVALLGILIKEWFPHKEVVFSSNYGFETQSEQKIIDLVKAVNGREYISGLGAKAYQSPENFESNGINLNYVAYPQLAYHGGLKKLSDAYSVYDFIAYDEMNNPFK
ncbi:MAG: WbqC family protein [Gammaproteobacteria bacterium]